MSLQGRFEIEVTDPVYLSTNKWVCSVLTRSRVSYNTQWTPMGSVSNKPMHSHVQVSDNNIRSSHSRHNRPGLSSAVAYRKDHVITKLCLHWFSRVFLDGLSVFFTIYFAPNVQVLNTSVFIQLSIYHSWCLQQGVGFGSNFCGTFWSIVPSKLAPKCHKMQKRWYLYFYDLQVAEFQIRTLTI